MSDTVSPPKPRIGKYIVEQPLGRGAMGVVYQARDPHIDRLVAVKMIALPHGLEDEKAKEYLERFIREARAAGKLNHPSIVTIYEAETSLGQGKAFIAMEYIEGTAWNKLIKKGPAQNPDHLLSMARELASALAYAHKNGVVHRDIKPANIMETVEGHAKLMDFGIAKVPTSELTREGQFLGSPAYMSPEQVAARRVDGRSDLFSLGTVLYEMLTGQKPFFAEDMHAVYNKILHDEPLPPSSLNPNLPSEVDAIITHLLAKDPERRYQNAEELKEDLTAYLGGAVPPNVAYLLAAEATAISDSGGTIGPSPDAAFRPSQSAPTAEGPKHEEAAISIQTPHPMRTRGSQPEQVPKAESSTKKRSILDFAVILSALLLVGLSAGAFLLLNRMAPKLESPQPPEFFQGQLDIPLPEPPPDWETPFRIWVRPALLQDDQPPPVPEVSKEPQVPEKKLAEDKPKTQAPFSLTYNFDEGMISRGEFWLSLDGNVIVHKTINKNSFTDEVSRDTLEIPAGTHTLGFRVKTELQNVDARGEEKVDFPEGGSKNLYIKMTKVNKKIKFEWK